ncbi:hypothetical protein ACLOJK_010129 [Asimina triloba]
MRIYSLELKKRVLFVVCSLKLGSRSLTKDGNESFNVGQNSKQDSSPSARSAQAREISAGLKLASAIFERDLSGTARLSRKLSRIR